VFGCIRVAAQSLPGQESDPAALDVTVRELNPVWQAPSFGPLNAAVAAFQANEAIRDLLGEPTATLGRRMLLDSRTYSVTWEDFATGGSC
jgi:hypothetical protein